MAELGIGMPAPPPAAAVLPGARPGSGGGSGVARGSAGGRLQRRGRGVCTHTHPPVKGAESLREHCTPAAPLGSSVPGAAESSPGLGAGRG